MTSARGARSAARRVLAAVDGQHHLEPRRRRVHGRAAAARRSADAQRDLDRRWSPPPPSLPVVGAVVADRRDHRSHRPQADHRRAPTASAPSSSPHWRCSSPCEHVEIWVLWLVALVPRRGRGVLRQRVAGDRAGDRARRSCSSGRTAVATRPSSPPTPSSARRSAACCSPSPCGCRSASMQRRFADRRRARAADPRFVPRARGGASDSTVDPPHTAARSARPRSLWADTKFGIALAVALPAAAQPRDRPRPQQRRVPDGAGGVRAVRPGAARDQRARRSASCSRSWGSAPSLGALLGERIAHGARARGRDLRRARHLDLHVHAHRARSRSRGSSH